MKPFKNFKAVCLIFSEINNLHCPYRWRTL